MTQTWNTDQYIDNASFVAELGNPVVSLLDPKGSEKILDLGCGDGVLPGGRIRVDCLKR